MSKRTESSHQSIKAAFFERIETERVCPRARWFFRGRECVVWILWLVSIVIGALAVAVSEFVLFYRHYALYEATHENFFTFMVEALPYIWLLTIGATIAAAMYNLRHTKRGYRYPVTVVLVSSVLLSMAGGSVLHWFGLGHEIDEHLGEFVTSYVSQRKYEERLWQAPEDGRLFGRQVYTTLAPTGTIIFEDVAGRRWVLDVSELHPRDVELLNGEAPVRLVGVLTSGEYAAFHACGAFPWFLDNKMSMEHMWQEREDFLERMRQHVSKPPQPEPIPNPESIAFSSEEQTDNCATVPLMQRIRPATVPKTQPAEF